ncbi:MAG: hypothetical protein WBG17_05255 [Burkholderiaceae bacterium]
MSAAVLTALKDAQKCLAREIARLEQAAGGATAAAGDYTLVPNRALNEHVGAAVFNLAALRLNTDPRLLAALKPPAPAGSEAADSAVSADWRLQRFGAEDWVTTAFFVSFDEAWAAYSWACNARPEAEFRIALRAKESS